MAAWKYVACPRTAHLLASAAGTSGQQDMILCGCQRPADTSTDHVLAIWIAIHNSTAVWDATKQDHGISHCTEAEVLQLLNSQVAWWSVDSRHGKTTGLALTSPYTQWRLTTCSSNFHMWSASEWWRREHGMAWCQVSVNNISVPAEPMSRVHGCLVGSRGTHGLSYKRKTGRTDIMQSTAGSGGHWTRPTLNQWRHRQLY